MWVPVLVLAGAALIATVEDARADDRAKATFRYEAGKSALVRGKLDEAIAAFRDAHGVLNTPATALSLAQALEKKGELTEALSVAKAGREIPKGPKETFGVAKARADLDKLVTKLEAKVPAAASASGSALASASASAAPVESAPAASASAAPLASGDAPPPKHDHKPAGDQPGPGGATVTALVGFSAFAFGTGLGLGAFFTSKSTLDDLDATCGDGDCAPFDESDYRDANNTRIAAFVGFGIGGAGLVTGIVGAALAGANESPKAGSHAPRVRVGLGTVEVSGEF